MLSSDALIVASLAAMLSSAAQTSMISMICFLVFLTMNTPRRGSVRNVYVIGGADHNSGIFRRIGSVLCVRRLGGAEDTGHVGRANHAGLCSD